LTFDGNAEDRYQPPVWWSPDGNHFCLFKTRLGERREITLIESAPDDQLQPKTIRVDYAKPGDRLDHPRLHLFGRDGRVHHVIDENQAPNPYSVTEVSWHPDGKSVRMLYNQRGHQRLSLLSLDVASGKTRAIIDELSPTFIDYAGKYFLRLLDDRDEAIWMSERSGWNHLYLIRQSTGEVIRPLTAGEFVVREVVRVDPEARTMLVAVGGYFPDQDPYHLHLLRVSLDGGPPVPLTSADGNHEWEFSPNGKYLVDRYSRVDLPPVTEIRSMETGESICVLEQADASELERAIGPPPTRFVAKGRDGKTDIWGFIIFPNGHKPAENRRYPVLEMIYAGPHSAHVPKSFGRMVDLRKTADLGFIIVRIDGMGTSHRGKAFHDVCWKNLADSGFPDRIHGPESGRDLGRVGRRPKRDAGPHRSRRLLQGRLRRLRLPRQSHGQDLVERAVDGVADRATLRRPIERDRGGKSERRADAFGRRTRSERRPVLDAPSGQRFDPGRQRLRFVVRPRKRPWGGGKPLRRTATQRVFLKAPLRIRSGHPPWRRTNPGRRTNPWRRTKIGRLISP
jgi:hypothetical protein